MHFGLEMFLRPGLGLESSQVLILVHKVLNKETTHVFFFLLRTIFVKSAIGVFTLGIALVHILSLPEMVAAIFTPS